MAKPPKQARTPRLLMEVIRKNAIVDGCSIWFWKYSSTGGPQYCIPATAITNWITAARYLLEDPLEFPT